MSTPVLESQQRCPILPRKKVPLMTDETLRGILTSSLTALHLVYLPLAVLGIVLLCVQVSYTFDLTSIVSCGQCL